MQQTQWSPSSAGIAACAIFGAVMATACVTVVTDGPGRLLAGIAAVGLLVFATLTWRARPKLAITPEGIQIKGWLSTHVLERADIANVRITEFRRIARKVRLLEIDGVDDRLHVFTRWVLGTDPINVLDALTEAGYAGKN